MECVQLVLSTRDDQCHLFSLICNHVDYEVAYLPSASFSFARRHQDGEYKWMNISRASCYSTSLFDILVLQIGASAKLNHFRTFYR